MEGEEQPPKAVAIGGRREHRSRRHALGKEADGDGDLWDCRWEKRWEWNKAEEDRLLITVVGLVGGTRCIDE